MDKQNARLLATNYLIVAIGDWRANAKDILLCLNRHDISTSKTWPQSVVDARVAAYSDQLATFCKYDDRAFASLQIVWSQIERLNVNRKIKDQAVAFMNMAADCRKEVEDKITVAVTAAPDPARRMDFTVSLVGAKKKLTDCQNAFELICPKAIKIRTRNRSFLEIGGVLTFFAAMIPSLLLWLAAERDSKGEYWHRLERANRTVQYICGPTNSRTAPETLVLSNLINGDYDAEKSETTKQPWDKIIWSLKYDFHSKNFQNAINAVNNLDDLLRNQPPPFPIQVVNSNLQELVLFEKTNGITP